MEGTGQGSDGRGVKGTGRYGVWGESNQAGFYGVFGRNLETDGTGVRGTGDTGVWGNSSKSGFSGVFGQHTGSSGYGLVGDGKGSGSAGVLGRNSSGYGGRFEGGKAQLLLIPGASPGPPTGSHTKGEIFMDSAANVFVCARGGNPAE